MNAGTDLPAIHAGDRTLLAQIALDEGKRLVEQLTDPGKRASAANTWSQIANWLVGNLAFPADRRALYAAAVACRETALRYWRKAPDQTPAHRWARHWLGLCAIEREMACAWADQLGEAA